MHTAELDSAVRCTPRRLTPRCYFHRNILKGQCHEIFDPFLFAEKIRSGPHRNRQKRFREIFRLNPIWFSAVLDRAQISIIAVLDSAWIIAFPYHSWLDSALSRTAFRLNQRCPWQRSAWLSAVSDSDQDLGSGCPGTKITKLRIRRPFLIEFFKLFEKENHSTINVFDSSPTSCDCVSLRVLICFQKWISEFKRKNMSIAFAKFIIRLSWTCWTRQQPTLYPPPIPCTVRKVIQISAI